MHGSGTRRTTRKRMRRTTETPAGKLTFNAVGFRASTISGIARNVGDQDNEHRTLGVTQMSTEHRTHHSSTANEPSTNLLFCRK